MDTRLKACMLVGLLGAAMITAPASGGTPASGSEAVEEYLMDHPEVLKRALANMQVWEREQRLAAMRSMVAANRPAITDTAAAVVGGNPAGDVTVYEFVDYNCGFCKAAAGTVSQAAKADGRVRVVYRMLPVLGEGSLAAAKVVLAAKMQDEGMALRLHDALLAFRSQVTAEVALRLAAEAGLDAARAEADAAGKEIASIVESGLEVGRRSGVEGTPTFVVGNRVLVGNVPASVLAEAIHETRRTSDADMKSGF